MSNALEFPKADNTRDYIGEGIYMNVKPAVDTSNVLAAAASVSVSVVPEVVGATEAKPVAKDSKAVQVDGKMVVMEGTAPVATPPVAKKARVAKKAEAKTEAKPKEKKVNTKLVAAKKIFDKMCAKTGDKKASAGDIAGAISKELKISYSNAYYYVTRVFGMKAAKAK